MMGYNFLFRTQRVCGKIYFESLSQKKVSQADVDASLHAIVSRFKTVAARCVTRCMCMCLCAYVRVRARVGGCVRVCVRVCMFACFMLQRNMRVSTFKERIQMFQHLFLPETSPETSV